MSGAVSVRVNQHRSGENGRDRDARKPTHIPTRDWKDLLYRVKDEIADDRVGIVAAGTTFIPLLRSMLPLILLLSGGATGAALAQSPPQPAEAPPLPPPRPPSRPPANTPNDLSTGKDVAKAQGGADDGSCAARLARLGVVFEQRPAIQDGACGGGDIVTLTSLPNGLSVSPPATMTCPVAEALSRWSLDSVSAEAVRHFGAAPTKVLIGTSYECRDQRNGAKLSEHAFADAVDIMGFEFAKRARHIIGFPAPSTPEAEFQQAVRQNACAFFTTVLGPGSDPDHSNHLHLDLRARKAGYRICQ